MKTLLFTILTSLALVPAASAAKPENLTLRPGQQRSAAKGELRVKFVKVLEDSSCPAGVACIWEGNAAVEIKVTDRRGVSKTLIINTSHGATGDQFGGYAIYLTRLAEKSRAGRSGYSLVLSIERLTR